MLPETLSNDLCSLKADEDKFTFSAVFVLSPEGEIKSEWFGRTVIHSKKRFTYEEAQEVLDTGTGIFLKELTTLNTLAKKMRKAREDAGAIVFDDVEVKFVLGESGHPLEIYKKERKDTNRLVEDFMLLANKRVAEFVAKKKKGSTEPVFIYRIHDKPDQEKIANLITFLKSLGHTADS
jgi:ribonuclease R